MSKSFDGLAMGVVAKALIALGFIVVSSGAGCVACAMSTNNDCVRQEAGIQAQWDQNRNNYANFFSKVKEMAQVPSMYSADLERVYKGAIQGRYGANGSQAVFQFIKEHNPTFDTTLYVRLQQVIEAGRDSFAADQKALLDKKRVYEVTLGSFPGGHVARFMGFPKKDIDKFVIVTNDETEKAFETGRAGPIQLVPAPAQSR